MSYCTLDEAFETPFNQCIKKKKKKTKVNCNKNKNKFTENYKDYNLDTNLKKKSTFEPFENYNPAEAFEYNENDNKPIKEIVESDNSDVDNSADDNSDLDNSADYNSNVEIVKVKRSNKNNSKKNNSKKNNSKKNASVNNESNSQMNEINNKINFLINQVNNDENSLLSNNSNNSNSLESNMHDIILFILFGVFVILILEALYKLVVKICRHQTFNSV